MILIRWLLLQSTNYTVDSGKHCGITKNINKRMMKKTVAPCGAHNLSFDESIPKQLDD
jgi:hypothetical protein